MTPFGSSVAGGSTTTTGLLVSGATGAAAFSATGRLILDTSGNVLAAGLTSTPVQVGTYQVDQFCAVVLTLTDVFATPAATTSSSASGTTTQRSVNFQGFLSDNGVEIDLLQGGTGPGTAATVSTATTTTTTPASTTTPATTTGITGLFSATGAGTGTVTGLGAAATTFSGANTGTLLILRRLFLASGCSVATLSGGYTLRAEGTDLVSQTIAVSGAGGATGTGNTVTITTAVPFILLGRIFFDGTGNVIQDTSSTGALISPNQFTTGSYTVSGDCTGTMTMVGADSRSRTANFVLNENIDPNACNTSAARAPEVDFVFTGANESGFGIGKRQ